MNALGKKRGASGRVLLPRFRVLRGREIALGPGKAELLGHIARTGSIARAASRMGMSYMRAWKLIKTMNACFRQPLVVTTRGGRERGGARLTKTGRTTLQLYQRLQSRSLEACADIWRQLGRLVRD